MNYLSRRRVKHSDLETTYQQSNGTTTESNKNGFLGNHKKKPKVETTPLYESGHFKTYGAQTHLKGKDFYNHYFIEINNCWCKS